ncbi:MAG: DDE-type integrase/transposase/recombinase, partial [Flavobacteriaceae bacterium]|nr:DDE-type integrase/transposase/recombinase [Flavobacteriaceae bacterium]
LGQNNKNKYLLFNKLLYSYVAPTKKEVYPRLVLPAKFRNDVINIAHTEVGHMSVSKTLVRLQEHFRWKGMTGDVFNFIALCPMCVVNRVGRVRPPPQQMPLPVAPGIVIAADLTGPFPLSKNGNKYLLSIIDHCTGWVEVKPISDKSATTIHDYIFNEYIPRFSIPNVFISDNGLEFKNKLLIDHFHELGVSVHHTTPYHPQSNGMIERYHRTLKAMLRKLTNSRGSSWEFYLPDIIYAIRTVPSDSTGFSPFYLTFGRHPGTKHIKLLNRKTNCFNSNLACRIDDLSLTLKLAVKNRKESRKYNSVRLERNANAALLKIGDKVVLAVNEPGNLDRKFDPGFIVVRVRGQVITVVGPNNVRRIVNRQNVRKVSSAFEWNTLADRLTRSGKQKDRRGSFVSDPLFDS